MFNAAQHYLLNHDCEACQYLLSAAYLSGLDVLALSWDDLVALPKASLPPALFVCGHHQNSLPEKCSFKVIQLGERGAQTDATISYLPIPFTLYELSACLKNVPTPHQSSTFTTLVGESAPMQKLKSMIEHVAPYTTNVLLLGESGVGKDVVANAIHQLSTRKDKSFVPVNCGAIPAELIESELFGHERGAFTGAQVKRQGRFELASGGTLFLDEIGDMPYAMQVKLLRVLQEKKIERVGGSCLIDVDVRLIAATNKNLEQAVQNQQFREDLFYRLNVFPIYVPALREHPDDIPLLIENHLGRIKARLQLGVSFHPEALAILMHYPWPGNIRELANFLERMVIMHPNQMVTPHDLDSKYHLSVTPSSTFTKEELKDECLEEALF